MQLRLLIPQASVAENKLPDSAFIAAKESEDLYLFVGRKVLTTLYVPVSITLSIEKVDIRFVSPLVRVKLVIELFADIKIGLRQRY